MNESVRGPFLSREAEIFWPTGAFFTTSGAEGPPVENGRPAGSSALTHPSASCDTGSREKDLEDIFVKTEVF